MGHTSNRQRIARAAEEARLTAAEKAETKAAKPEQASRSKRVAKPVRMKVVWEVCNGAGSAVKTFPYADKAAAEAATSTLTRSTGRTHILRGTKVPME